MYKKSVKYILVCLFLLLSLNAYSKSTITIPGDKLPQNYYLTELFYEKTDSIFINDSLLKRDFDYRFDSELFLFDFSKIKISEEDTLYITYEPLPKWLKRIYGKKLPESKSGSNKIDISDIQAETKKAQNSSQISISGTKTFRVSSSGSNSGTFGQGLDLNLSGNLTPEIKLEGVISDRGIDPISGYSNTRFSELDKIKITLWSKNVSSKLGDISKRDHIAVTKNNQKKLSGLTGSVNFRNYSLFGTLARPKGTYETMKFNGQEGRQGPYQLRFGNKISSVVPGSETVWLDGEELNRGEGGDYQIDYLLGQITFNVNRRITSRSRIEVDFEPQLDEFDKVYYDGGGAINNNDSSIIFDIAMIYEADSEDRFISDIFDDADKEFLVGLGDNVENAYRSGVQEDTTGAYDLVNDSLPDSVFTYVGENNGDYRISFSYIGPDSGAYRYQGNNRYLFVGTGNGEYNPVVLVPSPTENVYLYSNLIYKHEDFGDFKLSWNRSDYDKNRYSTIDDNDNQANFYKISQSKKFEDTVSFLSADIYYKDKNYRENYRVSSPDDDYRFLLPADFIKNSDEMRGEFKSSFRLSDKVIVKPQFSILDYKKIFRSYQPSLSVDLTPADFFTFSSTYRIVEASYTELGVGKKGAEDQSVNRAVFTLSKDLKTVADFSYSQRTNEYTDTLKGTKLYQSKLGLFYKNHSISFERLQEDSLISEWQKFKVYNSMSLTSQDNRGAFRYKSVLSYNKNEYENSDEDFWLTRLNLNYLNYKKQISVSSSYLMSRESRSSRGIRYLEVNEGEGDYILEDSIYIADPNGNYIKIEEILSDLSKVDRSERSFNLSKTGTIFKIDLSSVINEELLDFNQRNALWLIPFYSDEDNNFFYFNRRYVGNLRLFPFKNDYILTFSSAAEREIRTISGSKENKNSQKYTMAVKQKLEKIDFEEKIEYLREKKDNYYNLARDLEGVEFSFQTLVKFEKINLNSKFRYRTLTDSKDEKSNLYSFLIGSRLRFIERSEIRNSVELYYQDNNQIENSLVFNEYKPGEYGVVWSVTAQYGIKKDSRLNLSIRGRHADNQTARITGRMELVAGF